jgi:hypothetical protein
MVLHHDKRENGMTDTSAGDATEGPTYKLSLKGKGITVDQDVPADVARDIIALIMGGGPQLRGPRATTPAASSPRSSAGVSIREFIDASGAKRNPQIVTAIGLYLMDHDGQERFTRTEVRNKFSQAGEPTPSNIGRDVALAVSSGWIAENPRNQFYVTDTGRRAIEAQFEGQAIRRPRRRSSRKPKASAKEA